MQGHGAHTTKPTKMVGFVVEISFIGTRCHDVHLGNPKKDVPSGCLRPNKKIRDILSDEILTCS